MVLLMQHQADWEGDDNEVDVTGQDKMIGGPTDTMIMDLMETTGMELKRAGQGGWWLY